MAHFAQSEPGNILLTGRPGIGKTTVIMRLVEQLTARRLGGFYTDEIREHGHRVGFRATALAGKSCVLAHVAIQSRWSVGRYGVDLAAFEQLILPELRQSCELRLVDEIGKMECLSEAFIETVRHLFDDVTPLIATVPNSGGGFFDEVNSRSDVATYTVTQANRSALPNELVARLFGP